MIRPIISFLSSLTLCLSFFHTGTYAQCPNNNTFLANLTPAYSGDMVVNSCIKAGEYITTDVMVGNIYIFSACGQNGFNTQMTLRNSTGTVWYAFNDNFCSSQSQITWTATFTGSVRLLIDENPSCGHNLTCQQIMVTQNCQADAGTVSVFKNGSPASLPVYLCEGSDTLGLQSNNDYTLPIADSGEVAELMYMVFNCPPTNPNPLLDSCYSSIILKDKNFLDANPGTLATGARYFIAPVTMDDGDNGANPNNQVNLDNNADSCYDYGAAVEVVYLGPIAFASNVNCTNKSVVVSIFGGISEHDTSNYTLTNTGAGTITGIPVTHGGSINIIGLENGDFYSFSISDGNGCSNTFSGGPLSIPFAGEDTSITVCVSDLAFQLDPLINGTHDTSGKWYNPNGILKSGLFTPGTSMAGRWKYIVDGFAVCISDTSFMDIIIDSLYQAGGNSTSHICQFDSIVNLWNKLDSVADSLGLWFHPNGTSSTGLLNFSTNYFVSKKYKYLVNMNTTCPRDSSLHEIIMYRFPNAGLDTNLSLCSVDESFSLTAVLPGNPDTIGSWFDTQNNSHSAIFDPGSDSAGTYTYTVYGQAPCPDTSSKIIISISPAPNPGSGSILSYCRSDTIQVLIDLLNNNPDLTGTWLDPNNDTLTSSIIDPTNALSGVYSYTILGTSSCNDSSAFLNITFYVPPNPGSNDSVSVCSSDSSINLFSIILNTPDAGGNWTDPINAPFSGLFIPNTHVAGIYRYTVSGNSPCKDSSSYHSVDVIEAPNPGYDTSLNYCRYDSLSFVLYLISGNPDTGGTWRDPFNNIYQMPFDPASHMQGNYTYTVSGNTPCLDSSSTIGINVENPPNAGLDGSAIFCSSDTAVNLFSFLNGSPQSTGTWKDSSGSFFSGTFFPGSSSPGDYKYIVSGNLPCRDSTSIVHVTVNQESNPGINNSVTNCTNDYPFLLLSALMGSPDSTGYWKNPKGLPHNGVLNPNTDSSGIYKYFINGIGTCKDSNATVNVNLIQSPNPGRGDTLVLCSNDPPVQLFTILLSYPDSNGYWTNPGNQSINGIFNPSLDTSGIYRYTVPGNSPCIDSSSYLQIVTNKFSNAGSNGSISVCESDSIFQLFTVLTGSPDINGFWKNSIGNIVNGTFDPTIDSSDTFSYTVSGISPCKDSVSFVQVTVVRNVDAGRDTALAFCNNMSPVNLFQLIAGNPNTGGTWYKPSQSTFSGVIDPGIDSSGNYIYKVQGSTPCPDKSAILNVTVNILYNAGSDGSLNICENDPPFNFFNFLNGSPDIYGFWSDTKGVSFDGLSSSIVLKSGKYKYTLRNSHPCPEDSAFVDLTIKFPPNAGVGLDTTLCESDLPLTLFDEITGNPDINGLWYNPLGDKFGGTFSPSKHIPGIYIYVLTGETPCPNDSAFVDITVAPLPQAGNDQIFDICWNSEVNLSSLLDNTSDDDGFWLNPDKTPMNGFYNGQTSIPGQFFYVVPGSIYCPSDSMNATVSSTEPFNIQAGPDIYLVIGDKKPLKANSFDALRYEWEPTAGLSDSKIINPEVFTEITTQYIVKGFDQYECMASDTLLVTVLPKIFIPTSFTPNRDGLNDQWNAIGLSEYPGSTVHIYNEDRIEVFQSNNSRQGWDGTYNGRPVPIGNYYFIIDFEDQASFRTITGVITLVK